MKNRRKEEAELAHFRQRRIVSLERQLALQNELGEAKARMAAIVEHSDDAIISKDLNGIIMSWNRSAERIYGYAAEEAIGRSVSILLPPGQRDDFAGLMERIRHGESIDHYETTRLTKDGRVIDISLTISPIRDSASRIIGASTIARDISRRKKTDEILLRQAQIMNQIREAVITLDLEGTITGWNRGAEMMLQYTEEETLGKDIAFLFPGDGGAFSWQRPAEATREQGEEREVRLTGKAGNELYALLLLTPLRDDSGAETGMICSAVDITERRRAEERIRLDKEEWEQTFDAMPDVIAVIDSRHVIRRANRALAERLGVGRNELIGGFCYKAVCGLDEPRANCPGSKAIGTGMEQTEERFVERLKGHYLISCTPIFACDGTINCCVEVCRDISEQKKTEGRLREAAIKDQLTGLLNRRGFVAAAGHQLHLAAREKKGLMLLFLDLDHMKEINDRFGHKEGDRALTDTAAVLRRTFRGSDIIARLGGDEFAVLLVEPSDPRDEQIIWRNVAQNLEAHNAGGGRPYRLSLSLGAAYYDPEQPTSLEELMAAADSLMYEKKRSLSG